MPSQLLEEYVQQGLTSMQFALSPMPFLHYLALLDKWNKTYNLTSIRSVPAMVSRHIFDSLAIAPWLQGQRILDVGTGAGLPGIPLAIAFPQLDFVLLDSNGKKINFLREVKRQLNLINVDIVQSRVENFNPAVRFDTITSRAFSEVAPMIHLSKHLISADGIWLAMKGRFPSDELNELSMPYKIIPYSVLDVEGERCCLIIKNTARNIDG